MKSGLTAVALLTLLALGACGQSEEPAAPEIVAEAAPTDPDPKFIGAPNGQFQTAGDAILTTVRDVTYVVDSNVQIEVFVQPVDATLHVQLLNGRGEVLAEADAPAGQETRLTGAPSLGEPHNVIRLTRPAPTGNIAGFSLRIRAF